MIILPHVVLRRKVLKRRLDDIKCRKDKLLFTPGPLTTSTTVKQAMLRDLGSRDIEFSNIVKEIRSRLVKLGCADEKTFTAVPMQGSGTFGIESVISSTIECGKALLVCVNGAYGKRMVQIAETLGIDTISLDFPENEPIRPDSVVEALGRNPHVSHVAVCHCETTTGILNPIKQLGKCITRTGRQYLVDAMSSFGAVPIDLEDCGIDYLVSSSNKCIEGVPGFSFVLAKIDRLMAAEGLARSVSLDLLNQYRGLENDGQFRFTPPTHALLAFHQALLELEEEGGVNARAKRYQMNHDVLISGMKALGFKPYLAAEFQSHIIMSFYYLQHPQFSFDGFYKRLSQHHYLIYPGKVGSADCFRIGTIGRIFPSDVRTLMTAIHQVLTEMHITINPDAA